MPKKCRIKHTANKNKNRDRIREARLKKNACKVSELEKQTLYMSSKCENVSSSSEGQNFTRILFGDFSQGCRIRFINAGLQCSLIALESMTVMLEKHPSIWTKSDINTVVTNGNNFFDQYIERNSRILMISELPRKFERERINIMS